MSEEEGFDSPEVTPKSGAGRGDRAGDGSSKFDFAAALRKLGDHIAGAFT
ncbi:MAG: hypothetical protein R6U92_05590 [Bacillota bacterium]